ncbi:MAG: RNase adapter RapZ [Bacillota bacterium]
MRFIVITGISGAGKSLVAKHLEDEGFFCIDNLPPLLIPKIAEMCSQSYKKINKIAVVIDIRGGELLNDLFPALDSLNAEGHTYEILFMEASDKVVIKRYKESRRAHPLAKEGRLVKAIAEERRLLQKIKDRADYVIDTSDLTPKQLKEAITRIIGDDAASKGLIIDIISFGFKYGIPIECDLIFDVRFIPNPYYIESLRKYTGKHENVKEYVLGMNETGEFLDKLNSMLDFLIPNYIKEGKSQLVIGIGCTGGRHRSVAIADKLGKDLEEKKQRVVIQHRDIERDGRSAGR